MSLLIDRCIFLPSLSAVYCTRSRTTKTMNGPTPWYSPSNRGYSDISTACPIRDVLLPLFANPCQLLAYETQVPQCPHLSVTHSTIHRGSTFTLKRFLMDGAPKSNSVEMPILYQKNSQLYAWAMGLLIGMHFQFSGEVWSSSSEEPQQV